MSIDSMVCAGIDVSKDKLDIAIYPSGAHCVVAYDKAGLKRLDAFLLEHKAERVGFESSGGYELRLLAHLRDGPVPAARFMAGRVRAFAKSRLKRAKNDKADALVIASFTESLEALPPLPDQRFDGFAGHLTFIEQLEELGARLKTMLETTHDGRLRRAHQREISRHEARRQAELLLLAAKVREAEALGERLALLESIKGVGLRSALAILVRMPEIGSMSREEAAAMAGLAPYDDDSGTRKGRRQVAGGRDRLRKSLYMAAFAASRFNPDIKAFHDRLRANGKAHVHATVAAARKLIVLANAVVARNAPWQPAKAHA